MEKSKLHTLMNNLANEHLNDGMTSESVIELVNYLRPMIESEQFKKLKIFVDNLIKEHTKDGKLDVDSFTAELNKMKGS